MNIELLEIEDTEVNIDSQLVEVKVKQSCRSIPSRRPQVIKLHHSTNYSADKGKVVVLRD